MIQTGFTTVYFNKTRPYFFSVTGCIRLFYSYSLGGPKVYWHFADKGEQVPMDHRQLHISSIAEAHNAFWGNYKGYKLVSLKGCWVSTLTNMDRNKRIEYRMSYASWKSTLCRGTSVLFWWNRHELDFFWGNKNTNVTASWHRSITLWVLRY